MKHVYQQAAILLLGATLLTSGCSGGDRVGGIEGTGDLMASGSVTAFGSIWVNGVRFDTSEAAFLAGDELISEDDIEPGMVVSVTGTTDANGIAQATTVVVDTLINGPITDIGTIGIPYSQIQVLGQTVVVPEDVILAGVDVASLTLGQTISVSGLTRSDGTILATRLGVVEQADKANVEGVVEQVDAEQSRLWLGALEVDYSDALLVDSQGQPLQGIDEPLALGQRLKVEGEVAQSPGALFSATRIQVKDRFTLAPNGSRVVWEGIIEAFSSTDTFMLNGLMVDASNAQVERGNANQLDNGIRITASGEVTELGLFMADSITLLLPSQTRFRGTVESVESQTKQLTVLSTPFTSDTLTAFEDLGPQNARRIGLEDISSGDSVEVFGRVINDQWVATRIRRINSTGGMSGFRGPVTMVVSDSTFYVMGVLVDASDAQGVELIAELSPGQFVQVEGMQTGERAVQATRIQLLDENDCPAPVAAACGAKAVGKPSRGE